MRAGSLLLFTATALLAADTVLIVHKRADSVGLYDDATGAAIATIPVGVKPHEMALTRDGKFLFVTNYGLDTYTSNAEGGNTISIVDMAQRKVVQTMDLGRYRRPHGIERGRSGVFYVSTEVPAALHVIDPAKRAVLRSIETPGKLPHMLAVDEGETRAYLANAGSGGVAAVDLKAGKPLSEVSIGGVPMGLALTRDGKRLYATTRTANSVAVIDTTALKVAATIPIEGQPARVLLLEPRNLLLVTLIGTGELAVVDTRTNKEVRRVPIGANAEGVGAAPGDRFVYVSAQGENRVLKLSPTDWKTVVTFKTAERPDPILVVPGNR